MRIRFDLCGAAVAVALTLAGSAAGVAGDTPAAAAAPGANASKEAPPKKEETPADRIEKQLKAIQDRLQDVISDEIKLAMELTAAQGRANALKGYARKAALFQIAERVRAFEGNYANLVKGLAPLEKERGQATPDQQKRIDDLSKHIYTKHRRETEKIAALYEQVGETKAIYELWVDYYQSLPETKRDRDLKEKVAQQAEKCGDFRGAIRWWRSIFETAPAKDRYRDRGVGEKIGDLMVKSGDMTGALSVYKNLLEAIPAEKRDGDGKSLKDKIIAIEVKLGRVAPPPPPPKTPPKK